MNETNPEYGYKKRGPRLRLVDGEARVLPHSIEAEAAVLSAILLDGAPLLARFRAQGLTPAAFYDRRHRVCGEVLCEMGDKNFPISADTLAEELRTKGRLEEAGGYGGVVEVSKALPTQAEAFYYLDRVCELALVRAMIRDAAECAESGYAWAGGNVDKLLGDWALKMQRRADWAARRRVKPLAERMGARLEQTLKAAAGQVDRSRWIYTGLPGLDATIGAWDVRREHWANIIAGPPSGGKSSFMRHIAGHNVVYGEKRFAVFLLETGLMWTESLAATLAHVPLNAIVEGTAPRDMVAAYTKWYQHLISLADDRLFVFEDIYFVEDIERKVREIDRTLRERAIAAGTPEDQAHGLDGVVVDYLQIVATRENFRGNREQAVAHISMALKKTAKSLDVPFFIGAQINRAAQGATGAPTLAALRESGAIEQDADSVCFVYTPPETKAGVKQDGNNAIDEVEIVQRKRRNGVRDVGHGLLFYKAQTRYEERSGQTVVVRPGTPKPAGGYKREERS